MEKKKKTTKRKIKNNTQTVREWIPSAQLIAMAEMLADPADRRTKGEKIKDAGLTERNFYRWMKDERYINYINNIVDKYTNSDLPDVWKALMRKCKMGDTTAIKLLFDIKGMFPEFKNKKWYQEQCLEIERKKLAIIEAKNGNGVNVIEESNNKMLTLADMINNPSKDRSMQDFESEGN
jgi:hypothetical protein